MGRRAAVAADLSLAARASLGTIQRIAEAGEVEVHIGAVGGRTLRYRVWHGDWPGWAAFVASGIP